MKTDAARHSNPVGVAVVGSGYWGKNLVRNFHELGALRAVCDSDPVARQELAANYRGLRVVTELDEVLVNGEVTAVVVATPAATHYQVVKRCLEAGKDVFVEKPLALSLRDAEELVGLANMHGRILMVGHLLWYHPAIIKLKELVDSGELGKIQYIYSNRLNLGKIRQEENILWSFAPHDISVILGLLGEMPHDVSVQGGQYLQARVADVTVCLFSFPSGVRAHIFVSWLHPFKEQKLVIVGDRKMAVFDDTQECDKLVVYPHEINWNDRAPVAKKAVGVSVDLPAEEPLRAECRHFLERLSDRAKPRTDGAEGLRVLSVLERCQQFLSLPEKTAQPPKRSYFAHPSAFVDEGSVIGDETTIWHVSHILKGTKIGKKCRIGQNVVVGPNVEIGDGCKIQNNVSIYEGVSLEKDVFCGPSMVFTNVVNPRSAVPRMNELRKTRVRQGATLGANCTIVCGTTIGEYAFVAAGAVVTKDVLPYSLVAGVPARHRGWVCECGVKLRLNESSARCICERSYILSDGALSREPKEILHAG